MQPATGQVDGEDLVTQSSTSNLSSLKLIVVVWRSPRDVRDRDTKILTSHVALARMNFTYVRYKIRRTRFRKLRGRMFFGDYTVVIVEIHSEVCAERSLSQECSA